MKDGLIKITGKKQSKKDTTSMILQMVGDRHTFATPTDIERLYLYEEGVFVEARAVINEAIEDILKDAASTGFCNEIIQHFKRRSYVKRERFNNTADFIPLANGLLCLKTLTLTEHSPDRIFTFKLPTSFNSKAKCPKFLKAIAEIMPDADDRLILQEYAGYTLLPDMPHHKMLFCVGTGRNGKGVYIRTLESILGQDNVSNVRLEEFAGHRRFALAGLYGRLMNVCSEPSTKNELRTEQLKAIMGQDTLDAEIKNKQKRLKFRNFAKFFVLANKLPKNPDTTVAFWDRLLMVEFVQRFTDELGNKVVNIEDTWLKDENERSGVLNWMLVGLKRLMDNNKFTKSKNAEKQIILFKQKSDPIGAFLSDPKAVVFGNGLSVTRAALYDAYKKYVDEIGVGPESQRKFVGRVRELPRVSGHKPKVDGKQVESWKKIGLVTEEESEENNFTQNDLTESDSSEPEPKSEPERKTLPTTNTEPKTERKRKRKSPYKEKKKFKPPEPVEYKRESLKAFMLKGTSYEFCPSDDMKRDIDGPLYEALDKKLISEIEPGVLYGLTEKGRAFIRRSRVK